MKKIKASVVSALFSCLLFASSASAITIDLRSAAFSALDGLTTSTFSTPGSAVDITLSALSSSPILRPASLNYSSTDGIGIDTGVLDPNSDEVNGPETLLVEFSEAVMLNTVVVLDLFVENDSRGSSYAEEGSYSINGGSPVNFFATAIGGVGRYDIGFGGALVNSIAFTAPGVLNVGSFFRSRIQSHEFSLGGIDYSEVPEPATAALLGLGLMGYGIRRRRSAE